MSGRRDKLPVEPLSNEAWQRIQSEVFAELDAPAPPRSLPSPRRRRAREFFTLAAALIVVVGAAALLLFPSQRETAAPITTTLQAASGSTRATVGDVTVDALPGTELVSTGSDAGGWTVVIERGRASFEVPPRAGRPLFRVQAGSVAVEVVGTEFSVERDAALVRVSVERGSVRVTSGAESRLLSAGQRWQNTPLAAVPQPAPSAIARAVPEVQPPPSSKAKPLPSSRERYEAASRLEASDPERAVALYLEQSETNDAWAANALYAAGRLEFERGRHAAARALLERYLKRFPNGPNAAEARALLARRN